MRKKEFLLKPAESRSIFILVPPNPVKNGGRESARPSPHARVACEVSIQQAVEARHTVAPAGAQGSGLLRNVSAQIFRAPRHEHVGAGVQRYPGFWGDESASDPRCALEGFRSCAGSSDCEWARATYDPFDWLCPLHMRT